MRHKSMGLTGRNYRGVSRIIGQSVCFPALIGRIVGHGSIDGCMKVDRFPELNKKNDCLMCQNYIGIQVSMN